MPHLLHLDCSARAEGSISRRLSRLFADTWLEAHPNGTNLYRDLARDPVADVDEAFVTSRMKTNQERTEMQRRSLELTAQLVDEIKQADTVAIGVPMYNLSVPAALKAWIDRIIAAGHAVDLVTRTPLLTGKQVVVMTARGGEYGPGSPREGFDFQEPYLRAALRGVGLAEDMTFVHAELTGAFEDARMLQRQHEALGCLQAAEARVRELAARDALVAGRISS